ncbi:unnamed protein product, partial [Pleuronectes platessa]
MDWCPQHSLIRLQQVSPMIDSSQAEMTDWQVVEGHQSSASWAPGAQVMVRSHPRVLLLPRATAETSPPGCHVAVSMEMRRQAGRGSDSHLYAGESTARDKPPPPTVQPPMPWQCYPCGACREQWIGSLLVQPLTAARYGVKVTFTWIKSSDQQKSCLSRGGGGGREGGWPGGCNPTRAARQRVGLQRAAGRKRRMSGGGSCGLRRHSVAAPVPGAPASPCTLLTLLFPFQATEAKPKAAFKGDCLLKSIKPSRAQPLDSSVSAGFDSVIVRMKEGTKRAAVLMCQAQCPGSLTEQSGQSEGHSQQARGQNRTPRL